MDLRLTNAPDRILPSIQEGEQAVLGALLIDPDTIIRVVPIVRAEDFYLEKHAWIYEAILALHEHRQPIDFLTVVAELERRGKINDVGGAAYITGLINATPTAANVEQYARLVEQTAIQRRLIQASTQIAGLAYDSTDDIDTLIDKSEEVIFAVAQRRMGRELKPIRVAVDQFLDRLAYLERHPADSLGVPTGFYDLDKLLGGFQPSDLIIVAGRPGSGKTAFALSILQHAALEKGKRIALFSLEMSAEQLIQRLVAGMAQIDSQNLRVGKIAESEYPELVRATGVLSETNVFIDDSAAITPLEVRAKARRLHAEHGLDMVVIDYLQLMTVRGRIENRVQEISQISRQLKELARELDIPVVALSQLSRAVDARDDHRPQLSDLRESGCLAGETPVYLAEEGVYRSIAELAGQSNFRVLALNPQTWKFESTVVTRAFATGAKPVYRMTTRLGRTIRATANHEFLTIEGWRRLDELTLGTRIALPRYLSSPPNATRRDAELALLGHLIGDGCTLPRQVWRRLAAPAMQTAGITTRQMQSALGNAYCGTTLYKTNPSRERAARLANVVQSEELARLAQSEVYWDEIAAIESAGTTAVYDLTVERWHNFVAGDIVVHNSIEQDSDIVIFIFREKSYYPTREAWQAKHPNKEYPDKKAEVLVAKHRHGPTGDIKLLFIDERAKFENMMLDPQDQRRSAR